MRGNIFLKTVGTEIATNTNKPKIGCLLHHLDRLRLLAMPGATPRVESHPAQRSSLTKKAAPRPRNGKHLSSLVIPQFIRYRMILPVG